MTLASQKILRKNKDGQLFRVIRPQSSDSLLRTYHALKAANTTYIVNYGGGGSGKSYSTALHIVRKCLESSQKVLVIRKVANSLNDSVVSQFLEVALPFWGMENGTDYYYNKSNRTIFFKNAESTIRFRGLDNPEKMKSIQGITLVWIEEATELSESDFDILSGRIRGQIEPQIILTYNPISELHWLKKRFHSDKFEKKKPNNEFYWYKHDRVTVIFSTYLINPFVGQKYIDDMAWYANNDQQYYRVYARGEWGIIKPDNPFFSAYKENVNTGLPEYDPASPVYLSWDFNKVNTCVVSQHFDGGGSINYLEVIHGVGDLREMCRYIVQVYGRWNLYYLTGDSTGRGASAYSTGNRPAYESIKAYLVEFGINQRYIDTSRLILKNPNTNASRHFVNALILYFGSLLCIHKEKCKLLLDDLSKTKTLSDGSIDKNDCNKLDYGHAGDAFRYDLHAFEKDTFEYLRKSGKAVISSQD